MSDTMELEQNGVELELEENPSMESTASKKTKKWSEYSEAEKAEINNRKGIKLRKVIAQDFVNALKDKNLPAFGQADKSGNIEFVPSSVRSYVTGRRYKGMSQLVMQKYAKEAGFEPSNDGQTYVLTSTQAGFRNLKTNSKRIPVVSTSRDENSGNFVSNFYYLYGENSIVDKSKTILRDPVSTVRKEMRNDLVIDATKPKDLQEYFGLYNAACELGATFKTTSEVVNKLSQEGYKQLANDMRNGLDGKVYGWAASIETNVSKTFENLKAQRMAQQQSKEIKREKDMAVSF